MLRNLLSASTAIAEGEKAALRVNQPMTYDAVVLWTLAHGLSMMAHWGRDTAPNKMRGALLNVVVSREEDDEGAGPPEWLTARLWSKAESMRRATGVPPAGALELLPTVGGRH